MKLFKREKPKNGSVYTIKNKRSAFHGITGIVYHDSAKNHFSLFTGNSWIIRVKH